MLFVDTQVLYNTIWLIWRPISELVFNRDVKTRLIFATVLLQQFVNSSMNRGDFNAERHVVCARTMENFAEKKKILSQKHDIKIVKYA